MPVKIVMAILTVLALVVGPVSISAGDLSKPACCGNCAGKCCVKSAPAPFASQPLAPVTASHALSVESVIPALELPLHLCAAEVSRPSLPLDPTLTVARAPLFRRCGGLLL